nr:EOG090X0GPG [Ilyocryptus agilis]
MARHSGPAELSSGMKGFFCTSNREKDSVREAYNLLNEHADILYGTENLAKGTDNDKEEGKSLEIEDELSKEVSELKKEREKPINERRFQNVQTGVKGCIFIQTTVDSPSLVVDAILDDIEKKKQPTTKFLQRMLPIQITCKSVLEDIVKAAEKMLTTQKLDGYKNFSILAKIRNHNLKQEQLIEPIAELVQKAYPDIAVNLTDPEVSIVVEVVRKITCLGIVKKYNGRSKYNLLEFALKKDSNKTVE